MPTKKDTQSKTARKMQKRVEIKEDGRFLIYYTFADDNPSAKDAAPVAETARK